MKTKWKSKNLKLATVDGKIILMWILKYIIAYEAATEYRKIMVSFCHVKKFSFRMIEGYLSFERQPIRGAQ